MNTTSTSSARARIGGCGSCSALIRCADGGVRFAVWAPNAQVGASRRRLERLGRRRRAGAAGQVGRVGRCRPSLPRRVIATSSPSSRRDGTVMLKADPMAYATECPPADASVVAAPSTHTWGDDSWMATRGHGPGHPLRIYEVHLGSWRHGVDSYRELAHQLADHVGALGFTHVELLPVAEHPFGGSWGYQVTGYYAPTARFGAPDDFRAFVDELHQRGIGVILDWVPAHFPQRRLEPGALRRHRAVRARRSAPGRAPRLGHAASSTTAATRCATSSSPTPCTGCTSSTSTGCASTPSPACCTSTTRVSPGGGSRTSSAAARTSTRSTSCGSSTRPSATEVPAAMMIAEESTAWPKVTHPLDHGGLGFTHKWNMGWMHDTLDYFSTDPVHRRWHHRELSFGLLYAFSERFVLPISHDEVVHGKGSLLGKMPGDDWQKFANLRALFAWMWAMPGAPLGVHGRRAGAVDRVERRRRAAVAPARPRPASWRARPARRRSIGSATQWPSLWERDHEPTGFQWLDADDAHALGLRLPALGARRRSGRGLHRQLHPGATPRAIASGCRGPASGRCSSTPTAVSSAAAAIAARSRPSRRPPSTRGRVSRRRPSSTCRRSESSGSGRLARDELVKASLRDPRMRPVVAASLTLGIGVGVFGVVVRRRRGQCRRVGRCRPARCRCWCSPARQPVLRGQRDRRGRLDGIGARRRAAAGGAQRRLRADDGSAPRPGRSVGGWSPRS